jgi:hypothetical protein
MPNRGMLHVPNRATNAAGSVRKTSNEVVVELYRAIHHRRGVGANKKILSEGYADRLRL